MESNETYDLYNVTCLAKAGNKIAVIKFLRELGKAAGVTFELRATKEFVEAVAEGMSSKNASSEELEMYQRVTSRLVNQMPIDVLVRMIN